MNRGILAATAATDTVGTVPFYDSVLAANRGLRDREIRKLRNGSLDLENRQLKIHRRADTTYEAGARTFAWNRDATEAAARLLM